MTQASDIKISLNKPQLRFMKMPHKFKAYVAGFGAGKTWAGCSDLGNHFIQHPGVPAGYFAPSYAQIRDIFYPTIEEALEPFGFSVKVVAGNKEVFVYHGSTLYGVIICRSMDDPSSIVGFKIGKALIDEIDILKQDKAQTAWRKIIARMRYKADGLQNSISVTTTPEGFKFCYHQFVKQVQDKPELSSMYGLIQASTYDNRKNLPDDYIPSLLASYPPQLIDAYINGQFVNLKTGSVYVAYNRQDNACSDTIQPNETLFIGLDFNVGKMAAIVHVKRDGLPRAVDEIINAYDTPDMIRRLKERYWKYEGGNYIKTHAIRIYPDASGGSRKSVNASESDLSLLRQAGFQVIVDHANPPVKDRINAMNAMFCNALGERRYLVNHVACPTYAASLEQQAWSDSGEPDKTSGFDHCFTGDTLVHTRKGVFRFDQLPSIGEVIGPFNEYVPYHSARRTGHKATVSIDFAGGYMLECTQDHLFLTRSGSWVKAKDLMGCECLLSARPFKNFRALGTTNAVAISRIHRQKHADYIKRYGLHIMEKYQKNTISTIAMRIQAATKLKTLFVFMERAIYAHTGKTKPVESLKWGANTRAKQKNGISLNKGKNGTKSNTKKRLHCYENFMLRLAQTVAKNSWLRKASKTWKQSSVQNRAKPTIGARAELTMLIESANNAGIISGQISTVRAVNVTHVSHPEEKDVFCLTVPDYGCFRLSPESPIVSNCNDAGGYFICNEYPVVKRTVTSHSAW